MQFNKSHINTNNVWRELLIISDTKPIPKFTNGVITQKLGDYETIYYTDGLYQSHKEGDTYYNWYLINSKVVKETGTETLKQEVAELKEITNTILLDNLKREGAII